MIGIQPPKTCCPQRAVQRIKLHLLHKIFGIPIFWQEKLLIQQNLNGNRRFYRAQIMNSVSLVQELNSLFQAPVATTAGRRE
ncbi:hypothetical protein ACJX0J_023818, partial [Zea mays]